MCISVGELNWGNTEKNVFYFSYMVSLVKTQVADKGQNIYLQQLWGIESMQSLNTERRKGCGAKDKNIL